MGKFNSKNTRILATYKENDGTIKVLLFYEGERVREFIVGSNFRETRYDGALGYEQYDYEWTWGHYFTSIIAAADYWRHEVAEYTPATEVDFDEHGWGVCPSCGEDVYSTDWYCAHCGIQIVGKEN